MPEADAVMQQGANVDLEVAFSYGTAPRAMAA